MIGFNKKNGKVVKEYQEKVDEAKKLLQNTSKTENTLKKASKKLNRKSQNSQIKRVFEDILLLVDLVKAWIKKEYREIPIGSVTAILGAIIYFVSPIDVILDFIPGLGYIDDAFIITLVIKKVDEDLQKFKEWKENSNNKKI